MSRKIVLAWLTALVATFSLASVALAQQARDLRGPGEPIGPFIDAEYFDPDYQFFAQADVDAYEDEPIAHVGYYFTYDRLFVNLNRPEGTPSLDSGVDGDFTWGNRFDLGFMTNDDKGWLITITHIDGPNENFSFEQERLDRFNPDDGATTDDTVFADQNPRVYDIAQSINDADLQSIEICRTWRRKLHGGGVFEPFLGVRQSTFRDRFRRDLYGRFNVDDDLFPIFTDPQALGPAEVYAQDKYSSENTMLGAQFGFRYFKTVSHWTLSTELRMFGMQNWQNFNHTTSTETTVYEPGFIFGGIGDITGEGEEVAYILKEQTLANDHGAQFVWGGELRGEATYEITRDIALKFGFTMTDYARGLGRGGSPPTAINNLGPTNFDAQKRSQDLFMGGLTFGVAINR